jgi:hypothetical protein
VVQEEDEVHRCHVYVGDIATGCAVNVTCEVNVDPVVLVPLGAAIADTAGVYDRARMPIQSELLRRSVTRPLLLVARM